MANDSFIQVAPDSTGKQVDTVAVQTGAGTSIQRQRAEMEGTLTGEVLDMMLEQMTTQTQLLRAILKTLQMMSNTGVEPEDFPLDAPFNRN